MLKKGNLSLINISLIINLQYYAIFEYLMKCHDHFTCNTNFLLVNDYQMFTDSM